MSGPHELVNSICHSIAEKLGDMPFALIIWVKGEAEQAASVNFSTHPDNIDEAPAAARIAARAFEGITHPGLELHGLDTPERVCFYEQDFYPLSNFSAFAIQWGGKRFDTVEAAYHWHKFVDADQGETQLQRHIRMAPSAHEAFKLAQEYAYARRKNWDNWKVGIMRDLLRAKVEQHEYVRRKLLATGDRLLVENSWRDDFWGWGPNQDGQNMLGRLWMELRTELRESKETDPPYAVQAGYVDPDFKP